MSQLKTCGAKAAELIEKMVFNQYSTGGKKGGVFATQRAVKSAIILADEIISHVNKDGIAYWGRYWMGVKDELNKYLSEDEDEVENKIKIPSDEDEIDYKFINYNRDEDGIDIWIKDNSPIHLDDCYELTELSNQINIINKKVWNEPF